MIQTAYNVSEIELVYKNKCKAAQRPQITVSRDAYDILIASWDENKISFIEQAKVMLLNRANKVLGLYEVSTGGVTGTVIDPRLVFAAAIKANATAIILAHNHPSGNLSPSMADEALTAKIKSGGRLLDISMLDHLIVAENGFYSFADEMKYSL